MKPSNVIIRNLRISHTRPFCLLYALLGTELNDITDIFSTRGDSWHHTPLHIVVEVGIGKYIKTRKHYLYFLFLIMRTVWTFLSF